MLFIISNDMQNDNLKSRIYVRTMCRSICYDIVSFQFHFKYISALLRIISNIMKNNDLSVVL